MMNHRRRMLMNMASALPPKDTLENTSWANIAIVAAAGKASEYWAVGDTKTITFTASFFGSTSGVVRIIDFEYDDLADGSGKAPITFDMENCFANKGYINQNNASTGGWTSCQMRAALIDPEALQLFESAFGVGIIKPVSKRTSAGAQSTTIETTTDSIWLFSEYELFGSASSSANGEKPTDKSVCYQAFTNNASRVKKVGSTNSDWWERSPNIGNTYRWCQVGSGGEASVFTPKNNMGIVVGFCV